MNELTKQQRLAYRNQQVRQYFATLEKKHPQWRISALLEAVAQKFPPISPATVALIIKQQGKYAQ